MTRFRRLGEDLLHQGPVISLAIAHYVAPDGTEFDRQIVHHPGAVVVVPLVDEGTALLVRQFRAAVGGELLELPAGKRDVDGEPPDTTARRELAEEVGMEAGRLDLLARFYNSPGFSDELSYLYLARDLSACPASPVGVEEGHMTVTEVGLDDVPALIDSGELIDAKSIIGLTLARQRLGPAAPDPNR